jgi:hypothetical protein
VIRLFFCSCSFVFFFAILVGSVTSDLITQTPHDTKLYVCKFGTSIVDVYPKAVLKDDEKAKMIRKAVSNRMTLIVVDKHISY